MLETAAAGRMKYEQDAGSTTLLLGLLHIDNPVLAVMMMIQESQKWGRTTQMKSGEMIRTLEHPNKMTG